MKRAHQIPDTEISPKPGKSTLISTNHSPHLPQLTWNIIFKILFEVHILQPTSVRYIQMKAKYRNDLLVALNLFQRFF